MGTKLKLISAEEVHEYLSDEWARERLYDVDYAFHDNHQLALYRVIDLSQRELNKAIENGDSFILDETD
jgi:predicted metal-dependent hydrolase